MRLYPASLLLAWSGLVVLMQNLQLRWLLIFAALLAALALFFAAPLFSVMLKRTRWLFLTMIVLFVTMIPGVLLQSPWGFGTLTYEGLLLAVEHVIRLVAMLSLFAVLFSVMDHRAIVAGLYTLLQPFTLFDIDRRRIAVRLQLTLDSMATGKQDWRQLLSFSAPEVKQTQIDLPSFAFSQRDLHFACITVAAMVCAVVLM